MLLSISPDGRMLACWDDLNQIALLELAVPEKVTQTRLSVAGVRHLDFSPDSKILAVAAQTKPFVFGTPALPKKWASFPATSKRSWTSPFLRMAGLWLPAPGVDDQALVPGSPPGSGHPHQGRGRLSLPGLHI